MTPVGPADRDVIRQYWKATPAYIVAGQPLCLDLRDQAVLPRGRRYVASNFAALATLRPPKRWAMGVILCPDDTLADIAKWAVSRRVQDQNRFLFFHVAGVDLRAALQPWRDAGYPLPLLVEVDSWLDMAQILGTHVNNTILRDHTMPGWPI